MKNIIYRLTSLFIVALLMIFSVTACDQSAGDTGTIQLIMHDNPGDFDEVWVEVLRVEVNNQQDEETGWITISEPGESYNLLELVNGTQVMLGEQELEAGVYRQIRLILGDNNYVVIDGQEYDLQTPSAQQTGIKLNISAGIQNGIVYTIVLDFDAHRSVVAKGQTEVGAPFLLTPVIRTYAEAETGIISGVVTTENEADLNDLNISVELVGEVDGYAVSSLVEENTGEFQLRGLPAGTYDIEVAGEGYQTATESGIEVTAGEITDIGEITLVELEE
ncbi:MAG: DUF4382 domain-containing protein [Cyclonatronaceae bacterium]